MIGIIIHSHMQHIPLARGRSLLLLSLRLLLLLLDASPLPLTVEFDELLSELASLLSLLWLSFSPTVWFRDAGELVSPRQSCPVGGAFTGNRPNRDDDRRGGGKGPSSSPISDNRCAE